MIAYTLIKKNFKLIIFAAVILVSCSGITYLIWLDEPRLEINFLDVGQGDAAYIKFPNGDNLLIDTGPDRFTVNKVDEARAIFDTPIRNILLTHPDGDHVLGTEEIIRRHSVERIYLAKGLSYASTSHRSSGYLISGDILRFGNVDLRILNPQSNSSNAETNHNSIVSLVDYGVISYLLMADADKEVERSLISSGSLDRLKDKILILKVGHHGSKTSSSEAFLKKIRPEYCVISVGKDNSYGHPAPEVLAVLTKYCGVVYRTDVVGTIKFVTNGESLEIEMD